MSWWRGFRDRVGAELVSPRAGGRQAAPLHVILCVLLLVGGGTPVLRGATIEDDTAIERHAATLRPRHLPLAVTLRDPALERVATARPVALSAAFERAAGEELLQAREEALAVMRRQGVLVLDVAPRGAAEAVVERYQQ